MPKEIKLPDTFYGLSGAFGYFQAQLQPILQYPDLGTEVFHAYRVVGNTLIAVNMIEQTLVKSLACFPP